MFKKLRYPLVLSVGLLLVACGRSGPIDKSVEVSNFCSLSTASERRGAEKTTDTSVGISVYLDGTLSMLGYVDKKVATSRYSKALGLLKKVVTNGWQDSRPENVNFYHFGTRSLPIDEERYNRALKEDLYLENSQNPVFRVARIESAIPATPDPNQVSIVVTDLYQKDTDISGVSKLLRKYLERGLSVGVLGIKSEFHGDIYDIGIQNQNSFYSTLNQPKPKNTSASTPASENYRPFYILILGDYDRVNNFFKAFQERAESELLDQHQFVIFNRDLVGKLSAFYPREFLAEVPTGNRTRRIPTINNGKVIVKADDRPMEQLDITNVAEGNATIHYTRIPYDPLEHTLLIATGEGDIDLQNEVDTLDGKESSSLKNALDSGDWKNEGNQLSFTATIDANVIEKGVYAYKIDVKPERLEEPDWWEKWSAEDDNKVEGNKTHNLQGFLREIKAINQEIASPIARFCYIIQKK